MTLIPQGAVVKQGETVSTAVDCTDSDLVYIIFPIEWNGTFSVDFLLSVANEDDVYRQVYETIQGTQPSVVAVRFPISDALKGDVAIWYNSRPYEFNGYLKLRFGVNPQNADRSFTCFLKKRGFGLDGVVDKVLDQIREKICG